MDVFKHKARNKSYFSTYQSESYDGGKTSHKLVYNEDLWHPIPEDEPIHPEDYTFPEGVE